MAKKLSSKISKWSRIIHRDLSFFFSGIILVYAISGILLNHKKDFNSDYKIQQFEFKMENVNLPIDKQYFTKHKVLSMLEPYGEAKNYTKHYFPSNTMKVFLKGGSSMVVDLKTGKGLYEEVRKRPIFSGLNRLHYNPNRWWTIFSDIFAVSLIIITISGVIMNRGKNGVMGRGGIELIIGILIPILFLFFMN